MPQRLATKLSPLQASPQFPARGRILTGLVRTTAGACLAVGMGGCSVDSYLNPSITGRWEATPTTVPILDRISAIEDDTGEFVEYSEITAADLLPQVEEYRIVSGDALQIFAYDLIQDGVGEAFPRVVDASGRVEIPQLGRVVIAGLTEDEAKLAIEDAMRPLVGNPLASVVVAERRQQTFNIFGAVPGPGQYFVPSSDYRVLQALTAAGGLTQGIEELYVIRQVSLVDQADPAARGSAGTSRGTPRSTDPNRPEAAEDDLIDLIRELTDPDPGSAALSVIGVDGHTRTVRQPARSGANSDGPDPIIDLPGSPSEPRTPGNNASNNPQGIANASTNANDRGAQAGRWVFLDGRWMQVAAANPTAVANAQGAIDDGLDEAPVVTQRVIRVPAPQLAAGDASVNIVIRPGDIIRVPLEPVGRIYVEGQVARPGVYNLPQTGKLSLSRAITAAGGLGGLAIPERVDLTRMVGSDRQATIMLNLRAIKEGTHPDVYLKPDDVVNVGTNFWATPLAVFRGGLRSTYGFGFLMDRNFGNDVFGPPPVNLR